MGRKRGERGAVTAETAVVLPVLILLAAVLAWMVAFGIAQVRVIDAARETARSLARGDDPAVSTRLGKRIAPGGAKFAVRDDGDDVTVTVTADIHGPGGLWRLLGRQVRGEAVTTREASG